MQNVFGISGNSIESSAHARLRVAVIELAATIFATFTDKLARPSQSTEQLSPQLSNLLLKVATIMVVVFDQEENSQYLAAVRAYQSEKKVEVLDMKAVSDHGIDKYMEEFMSADKPEELKEEPKETLDDLDSVLNDQSPEFLKIMDMLTKEISDVGITDQSPAITATA